MKPEQLKEIADQLDMGMRCFYNINSGELECIPDPDKHVDVDESEWKETIEKIEKGLGDYLRFDAMDTHESFSIMADFVDEMPNGDIRNGFIRVLQQRKPFREFKSMLQQSPELLQQWYAYKEERYIEFVKQIAESYSQL